MNTQAEAVFRRFRELKLPYESHEHAPIPTADARLSLGLDFDAQVCKNLLVSTRSESRFLLLMLPVHKNADLKQLRAAVGSTRLGFASDRALESLLGQRAGSVGVLGVINDRARMVEVVFDSSLRSLPRVATHPGDNTLTLVTAFENIEKYVRSCGNKVLFFDF